MSPQIAIDRGALQAFCERHHVARLALFGSVLRDDFDADSDVDVLVEFQPGHVPGLSFVSMERELSGLIAHDARIAEPAAKRSGLHHLKGRRRRVPRASARLEQG